MCCIITCLAACSWSIHPGNINSRQTTNFNLILTAVTMKLLLSTLLPPLSYQTLLDWYVIASNVALVVALVGQVVLPFVYGMHKMHISVLTLPPNVYEGMDGSTEEDLVEVDQLFALGIAGAWIGFNVIYVAIFLIIRKIQYNRCLAQARREMRTER